MTVSKPIFLNDRNFGENLSTLANGSAKATKPASSFCTTKKVFQMVPKRAASEENIRSWAVTATVGTVAFGIWSTVLGNLYFCMQRHDWSNQLALSSYNCLSNLGNLANGRSFMVSILTSSATAICGLASYGIMSCWLQDRSQKARFEELEAVYSGTAQHLVSVFEGVQSDEDKKHCFLIARKIEANKSLVGAQLKESLRLNETQIKCLTERLSAAANYVLLHDKSPK